jgi:LytS/YehU family sensor histidine kinase
VFYFLHTALPFLNTALPLGAFFVVLVLYRQQIVKNQKDRQLLRQSNELMKANYLAKISEGKLIALRAQLNPHFIFNCLNSINAHILKADARSSSDMLLKFAKLVRLILEKSDKKMIPLSEELKLIHLYVDLEKTRSQGLYRTTIEVDPTIDVHSISIPSLIAQPFVENAILHAFREKKQENLIAIKYYLENDLLFCSVEDNGVGRKTPTHIESCSEKNKSMGISISEQRINLITGDPKHRNAVTIEDIVNSEGQPKGTKVIILVPFVLETIDAK